MVMLYFLVNPCTTLFLCSETRLNRLLVTPMYKVRRPLVVM